MTTSTDTQEGAMTLEKGLAAFLELLPLETAWVHSQGPCGKIEGG